MKKILIVEDDEKVAKALELRLRSAGYDTAVAGDGYSGVLAATRTNPDLLLLDINMPAGNGFTVAERIRSVAAHPIPIIFITASKQPELLNRAISLGASGFIEKPYHPSKLLTLLENVISHHATHEAGGARPESSARPVRLNPEKR